LGRPAVPGSLSPCYSLYLNPFSAIPALLGFKGCGVMFRHARAVLRPAILVICGIVYGLLGSAPPVLAQPGLTGDWELAIVTPQGPNTVNLSLTQDGEKVTGTLTTPLGSLPVEGTASEGNVKLGASVKVQGAGIDLGLNGKLSTEGMSGMVKLGDFGEFPFTGKRAPKAAAAAAPAAPAAAAGAADVTDANGTWNITLSIGGGQVPASATFKQEGEQVTGTLKTPIGEAPVHGTMVGKDLKLELSVPTPQGTVPVTLTGTLDEKGFAGKMSITGVGDADWTGVRAGR